MGHFLYIGEVCDPYPSPKGSAEWTRTEAPATRECEVAKKPNYGFNKQQKEMKKQKKKEEKDEKKRLKREEAQGAPAVGNDDSDEEED